MSRVPVLKCIGDSLYAYEFMFEQNPLAKVLRKDPRYHFEAYTFVRSALAYAQDVMKLGDSNQTDESSEELERHLTGQQLCEASRLYAIEQYGMMARVVLKNLGINSTSDLGEIVYNLIDAELMKKSEKDRREDFNDVFDFATAFEQEFEIGMSE